MSLRYCKAGEVPVGLDVVAIAFFPIQETAIDVNTEEYVEGKIF